MVSQKEALKQLSELKTLGKYQRLAAEGWPLKWQTLISIVMSARTLDRTTIPVAQQLFTKYTTLGKLSKATPAAIGKIIRPVNFYRNKSKNINNLAKILVKKYRGEVPMSMEELVELPGVGRKTANVFLAEYGGDNIGVDTHLSYCSQRLGWTKNKEPAKIEKDLEKLFPKKYWRSLNEIVVHFGQTFTSRKKKNEILDSLKAIK